MERARTEDIKIGGVAEINEDVINIFVEAYVAHCCWYKFQDENMGNAWFISAKYYVIAGSALIISFLLGIAINFIYDYLKQITCN